MIASRTGLACDDADDADTGITIAATATTVTAAVLQLRSLTLIW
jgi:hypothetical protein